ncbi:lysine-ketoglutarate reductase/saccharopine dehydrogenase-like protein (TIGR00300 family) [Clostridiales Family XIII bacterium PM5-7]
MFKLPAYIQPDFTQEKFVKAPEATLIPSEVDKSAPDNFHATSIFPEYFKIDGKWHLAEDSRMDCVPVYENGKIYVREFRNVKKGDLIVVGRTENCEEGIYVHVDCFEEEVKESAGTFAFRQNRSRETAFSYDYEQLYALLEHEKQNNGYVVWVLGPACSFDAGARKAFAKLIENGYVQAVLAGNALATHDLEAGLLGTALGQDIKTQRPHINGHYNHLDAINLINRYGSIPKFIEEEHIDSGIMNACVKHNVPFVLNGSIRDDGPLPEVYEHTYEGQDTIRSHVRKATTVIGMATVLHTIATGNMTPTYRVLENGQIRPVYFYMVDTSEFAANKLGDRGSLAAKGIVTNVQDFTTNVSKGLGL